MPKNIPPEKRYTCKICENIINKSTLTKHLKSEHDIPLRKYYDKFYKKLDEGVCPICNKPTNFFGMKYGYAKHCSLKCSNNNSNVRNKQSDKYKKWCRENPEKVKEKTEKGIKTLKNNPEIIEHRKITRKRTMDENPEIQININKNHKEILRNDPSITERRISAYKETINNDPSINFRRSKNIISWCIENPDKVKRRGNKLSITKRNKHNQLCNYDSNVPYFLYIIQHLEKPIIKIGRSENPERRLRGIINDFGNCEIIHTVEGFYNKIQPLESYLHDYFNDYCQVQPSGGGKTEWFDECILKEVLKIVK